MFIDKVQDVENKFMDLEQRISDPSVIARQDEWQKLTKEHASLMPLVETFRKYKDVAKTVEGDKEILNDALNSEKHLTSTYNTFSLSPTKTTIPLSKTGTKYSLSTVSFTPSRYFSCFS